MTTFFWLKNALHIYNENYWKSSTVTNFIIYTFPPLQGEQLTEKLRCLQIGLQLNMVHFRWSTAALCSSNSMFCSFNIVCTSTRFHHKQGYKFKGGRLHHGRALVWEKLVTDNIVASSCWMTCWSCCWPSTKWCHQCIECSDGIVSKAIRGNSLRRWIKGELGWIRVMMG